MFRLMVKILDKKLGRMISNGTWENNPKYVKLVDLRYQLKEKAISMGEYGK